MADELVLNNPLKLKTIQVGFDSTAEAEMRGLEQKTSLLSEPALSTDVKAEVSDEPRSIKDVQTDKLNLSRKQDITSQRLSLMGAGLDILNAQFEFSQLSATAERNIALAEFQKGQILSTGAQAAGRAETAGFAKGEQSVLGSIAQGQEATGGVARSGQLAEETLGVYSAAIIETNALRQAYGIDVQIAAIESELEIAEINRNFQIASGIAKGLVGAPSLFNSDSDTGATRSDLFGLGQ